MFGFNFGGEKPALPETKVEKSKRVIEPNKRQQDKLIAALLGNKGAMSQKSVEVSEVEKEELLKQLNSGRIQEMRVDMLLAPLYTPVETGGRLAVFNDLASILGSEEEVRNMIYKASEGKVNLSPVANSTDLTALLNDKSFFLPGPAYRNLEKITGRIKDERERMEEEKKTDSFLHAVYGKRYEYYQQFLALKDEARERFGSEAE